MPVIQEQTASLFVRDDDEGLFSRDINGQLVRLDAPTSADYDKTVTMEIDGQPVTVPLAEPLKDANGNIVLDLEGRTKPRYTTIYDAAIKLYVKHPGDEVKIPIPTLCHLPHMTPVAVCRLCVVQIYGQKRGKRAAERKLLPACQHPVKNGMEVFTMNAPGPDGDRVRQAVTVMTELLAADHLKPPTTPVAAELAQFNELGQMTERCGGNASRFQLDVLSDPAPPAAPSVGRRQSDLSSPVFAVDHSACILCERCVRACDEVMENNVIGRTGKGATAGIGFDLNDRMGDSSCVQCGECMVSCPTSAITFKPVAPVKAKPLGQAAKIVSASDLIRDPSFLGIPPKFLLWQQGLVVRRQFKAGQYLCRQGDAGNTAFLIKSGRFEAAVFADPSNRDRSKPVFRTELTAANVIVGEMACLTGVPRAADVRAIEDSDVLEVRRNVLDRLMRIPSHRQRFEAEYRTRSLDLTLQNVELFKGIAAEDYKQILEYLRNRISFVRVSPGQVLFRQGDPVNDLYLIRLGYVRVGVKHFDKEARVISLGPGNVLGEIGLLAFSPDDVRKSADEADLAIETALLEGGSEALPAGLRTATCSALGPLELARLSRADFMPMLTRFPSLRKRLIEQSLHRLRDDNEGDPLLQSFVEQGLYEGRSILALDMDLCTRCDECTRGCVQQHGEESHGVPITRLLRDGRRFENYLIGTACRSCADAHCMVGCPVDSIHRGKHLQIVIEDHCIGCGLCASNCPYGNIFMIPNEHRRTEVLDLVDTGVRRTVAQPKAATCDLCDAEGKLDKPEPRCVSSCPHDAAFRLTGEELLDRVRTGSKNSK